MASVEELKGLLNIFSSKLSEENIDKLFSTMKEVKYKQNEPLVKIGEINDNIYIVKEGIIRAFHCDKNKEITLYFGVEGDLAISLSPFQHQKPSVLTIEACCDSVIMVITKEDILKLFRESLEFSNWALSIAIEQLQMIEMKRTLITGDAYEKYNTLVKKRPEILQNVPLRSIASYLGITQQSLSRLRNPKYKKPTHLEKN